MNFRQWLCPLVLVFFLLAIPFTETRAAGLLKSRESGESVRISSHKVDVTIINGFVKTVVDQEFENTTDQDLETVYTFPLPKEASLSELSLFVNGKEMIGEVLEAARARAVYEEQRDEGVETALAEKKAFRGFNVSVGLVPARDKMRVRLAYFQPLDVDHGVARYLYPLAEGNVGGEQANFWAVDDKVSGPFSFSCDIKSAFPIMAVRLPGYEKEARIEKIQDDANKDGQVWQARISLPSGASLDRDLIVYYRLDPAEPARLDLLPYKPGPDEAGTFMMVLTPAMGLAARQGGMDWILVLDISGSMKGDKIKAQAKGAADFIRALDENDRFGIVAFNKQAHDLTKGLVPAFENQRRRWAEKVQELPCGGGTDIFTGMSQALAHLDETRSTGLILVSDGVTNEGSAELATFFKVLDKADLRLFAFVMGNSANQPFLEALATETGGFAMNISAADDLPGRLLQARSRIFSQYLKDVSLSIKGKKVTGLTPSQIPNLYRGRQLVVFGRYDEPGLVEVTLSGKIDGNDKFWSCRAALPDKDTDNPELERLWALSAVDDVMKDIRESGETQSLVREVVGLGTEYSLVTDYTSMVVVREDRKETYGVGNGNTERVLKERAAMAEKAAEPVKDLRQDNRDFSSQAPEQDLAGRKNDSQGMYKGWRRPRLGGGGGPVGPLFGLLALWLIRRKKMAAEGKGA